MKYSECCELSLKHVLYNHFANNGMNEGRAESQYFDLNTYKNNNGDLRNAYGNNNKSYITHYINYGRNEGRSSGEIEWVRDAQVITTKGIRYIFFRGVSNAGNVSSESDFHALSITLADSYVPEEETKEECAKNHGLTIIK